MQAVILDMVRKGSSDNPVSFELQMLFAHGTREVIVASVSCSNVSILSGGQPETHKPTESFIKDSGKYIPKL